MSHERIANSTTIGNLPPELFVETLSYLPEDQLKAIKCVCRNWQSIINTHLSLYGKFRSMQHWHDASVNTVIRELEQFKNDYTIKGHWGINLNDSFVIFFIIKFVKDLRALCIFPIMLIINELMKHPIWQKNHKTADKSQIQWTSISVYIIILLAYTTLYFIIRNKDQNQHRLRNADFATLDKLKMIYDKRKLSLNELPGAEIKQLFSHSQGTVIAAPINHQQLNQKISNDCAKLSQLKVEIDSHANVLVKQTVVNRDRVSHYCLRTISLWNQTNPRRHISFSDEVVSKISSALTCTSMIKRRVQ